MVQKDTSSANWVWEKLCGKSFNWKAKHNWEPVMDFDLFKVVIFKSKFYLWFIIQKNILKCLEYFEKSLLKNHFGKYRVHILRRFSYASCSTLLSRWFGSWVIISSYSSFEALRKSVHIKTWVYTWKPEMIISLSDKIK